MSDVAGRPDKDSLLVRRFETRAAMGQAAADGVAEALRRRLSAAQGVRMIFAAAPSQAEMLESLAGQPGIDWARVTAFHMDEYIGLPVGAPQRFGTWLRRHLFDRVPLGRIHIIEPDPVPESAARSYATLLREAPIDIVCLGIGVNGHLAFHDPPVADLRDSLDVKVVELDEVSRQQQVDDGCFPTFGEVPTHAVTLTIPRLLEAEELFCIVPGTLKRRAVWRTLHEPIGTACPATALRTHPRCTLYLDREAAADV